jgi:hypothetical protein
LWFWQRGLNGPDCAYFAESTRTQYFEVPPFFVPVAGITV